MTKDEIYELLGQYWNDVQHAGPRKEQELQIHRCQAHMLAEIAAQLAQLNEQIAHHEMYGLSEGIVRGRK